MRFRASFCDPFQPEIIELKGITTAAEALSFFQQVPWLNYLERMAGASHDAIFYAPSFEVENQANQHGLSISVAGEPQEYEFYVFYKRPKKVRKLFGLVEVLHPNYLSEIHGQTLQEAGEYLNALLRNDLDYLTTRVP
ncbi:hypothetical protein [Solirubrum puertoriconensis]|uniref:Uncharacterized protein n=1 Tax=Solirubrum puertoriconensis TaxID=1751427 RepID=A0A9X0L4A9_SOLP1|nr:hypothetical protein [Solirubrum puertoriconensis]KUG07222.1 hypothetical protein ASU33_12675 [Solirubrum puertoriconensis]